MKPGEEVKLFQHAKRIPEAIPNSSKASSDQPQQGHIRVSILEGMRSRALPEHKTAGQRDEKRRDAGS